MEVLLEKFLKNLHTYYLACGLTNLEEEFSHAREVAKIETDIPNPFLGLVFELCNNKPQYYWNREVAIEVEAFIDKFVQENYEKFNKAFVTSSTEFFEAIRAYENITAIISELRQVSFEEGYKTKLLRNPLLSQIYEDFLMNLYRLFKNVVNEFSEKDYSNLNTLGAIIPCLQKFGLEKCTNINPDIRNAVNHGNLFIRGNELSYRHGKTPKDYKYETISIWEYDDLIDQGYDIACGILMGMIRALSKYPEIIEAHYSSSEEFAREWYCLTFKTSTIRVLYLNDVTSSGIKQFNIHVKSEMDDYNKQLFAFIELVKGAFLRFPDFDSYFVGFEHDRGSHGYIRLTQEQLIKSENVVELAKMMLDSGTILMSPILSKTINANAYKYHVFPKIQEPSYDVLDIQNCSVGKYKRIKAKIILSKRFKKNEIKPLIEDIISKMVNLETPQNPSIETKYGKDSCDMIYLNVYTHSYDRSKFQLFPSNDTFICTAHYYKDDTCPRLEHGGVPISLWNSYKKEKIGNIEIAWNPTL